VEKVTYLIFGFHCHQPVGNEDYLEKVFKKSYDPLIDTLREHPRIKAFFHYSGPVWDYIFAVRRDYLDKLYHLYERGQIEIATGGYYEPIMPIIPPIDRLGQIHLMTERVGKHFPFTKRGMWIAERVWEPQLAYYLAKAGVDFIILDDEHLKSAGVVSAKLHYPYVVEDLGAKVIVFGSSMDSRYLIPYAPVEKIKWFLESCASDDGAVITNADDGEKFGEWPGTYHHCYEEKHLEHIFNMIENSSVIIPISFSEYLERFGVRDKVVIPANSYQEMGEWASFAPLVDVIHNLNKKADVQEKIFIHGTSWRNFLKKYRESDALHKKMLEVSSLVNSMQGQRKEEALVELYQGQCNCPYWHGLFGGLYYSHLRGANYHHLIKAEVFAEEEIGGNWGVEIRDFFADFTRVAIINSKNFKLYIDLDAGGIIFELDEKKHSKQNIVVTKKRQYEAYHSKIKGQKSEEIKEAKTIHEIFVEKQNNLKDYLFFDEDIKMRGIGLVRFAPAGTSSKQIYEVNYQELGNFLQASYSVLKTGEASLEIAATGRLSEKPVELIKSFLVKEEEIILTYKVKNRSSMPIRDVLFIPEVNLSSFLSPKSPGEFKGASLKVNVIAEGNQTMWYYQIQTVSGSESGIELTPQSQVILPVWEINLSEGEEKEFILRLNITKE